MSVLDKTPAQIVALKINTLSDEDISALTTAQLAALTTAKIAALITPLSPSQVPYLTKATQLNLDATASTATDNQLAVSTKVDGIGGLLRQHCASGNFSETSVLICDQRPRPPPDLLDAPSLASRGGLAIGGT